MLALALYRDPGCEDSGIIVEYPHTPQPHTHTGQCSDIDTCPAVYTYFSLLLRRGNIYDLEGIKGRGSTIIPAHALIYCY